MPVRLRGQGGRHPRKYLRPRIVRWRPHTARLPLLVGPQTLVLIPWEARVRCLPFGSYVASCEGFRMPAPRWWRGAYWGPAYANLRGRKPREVWRGRASDAMGISSLAVCVGCWLNAFCGRDREGWRA